ncbi:MAG: histidine kinase, partial [Sphingobacteriaceae bacterium]|nr:histidine kinase [Cytophagaceae bacterium]
GFCYTPTGDLLLGHTNALNILTLNQLNTVRASPKIAVSSMEIWGKPHPLNLAEGITLRPDENSVTFQFSALNFEPASQNRYAYRLEGFDENWVDLGNEHTVSFTNLPPAAYRLSVKSGNGAGVWSETPLAFNLTVRPYFTNTWWFRTLVGVLIGGLIAGLVRWWVSTLSDRNRMDLQVTELKLKALQSQMNPHFLFNSLNSVQNFLLTNQGLEGAKYLSKCSKLVRRIMENSNHPYLRFEQIIDTLRMYVEIESFRFNHEFSYEFDIADDEVLLDAFLPPMLLQPYVENAIWHGLMPKEGEKKLKISARIERQHLVCTIEDNGVGRAFAPRKEGHISRGQEMTEGIFDSLRRNHSQARLDVLDLYDTGNRPAGTRVAMTIPLEKT